MDRLPDPTLYHPASYVQALAHLLAVVGRPVAWLGTGLGGVCGMVLAAAPGHSLTRLVLNDVGPLIPAPGQARIRDSFRQPSVFPDLKALDRRLRAIHAGFGRLGDAQWAQLARSSARRLPDGRVTFHYDPAIGKPILEHDTTDQDFSAFYSRVRASRGWCCAASRATCWTPRRSRACRPAERRRWWCRARGTRRR